MSGYETPRRRAAVSRSPSCPTGAAGEFEVSFRLLSGAPLRPRFVTTKTALRDVSRWLLNQATPQSGCGISLVRTGDVGAAPFSEARMRAACCLFVFVCG
jgi:hypothetical protein